MRSLLVIITVVLLGVAPLGGLTVLAQDSGDEAWMGVTISENAAPMGELDAYLGTTGSLRARMKQGHRVTFENSGEMHAHIPEVPEAGFMAVYVNAGEFVLDVMTPTSFIVDPAGGRTLSRLTITGDANVAYYSLNEASPEAVMNEDDQPCTEMCTVPPPRANGQLVSEDERTAVQLLPGDWILAPAGGLCVWCLLNTYAVEGTTGELFVYPLSDEEFAWAQAASAAATPSVQGSSATGAIAVIQDDAATSEPLSNSLAWAFFNPAPNCRSG